MPVSLHAFTSICRRSHRQRATRSNRSHRIDLFVAVDPSMPSTRLHRVRPVDPPGRVVICLPVNFKRDYGLHRIASSHVASPIPISLGRTTTVSRCQLLRPRSVTDSSVRPGMPRPVTIVNAYTILLLVYSLVYGCVLSICFIKERGGRRSSMPQPSRLQTYCCGC